MTVRIEHTTIELPKARKVIRAALKAGYNISVYDGEAYPVKRSTHFQEINQALASTDCDTLIIRDANANRIGSVVLIWGNDDDVISDWSDNEATDALIRPFL